MSHPIHGMDGQRERTKGIGGKKYYNKSTEEINTRVYRIEASEYNNKQDV